MKILVGFFIAGMAAATAAAQDTPPAPLAPVQSAKIVTSLVPLGVTSIGPLGVSSIKNTPFQAEEVNESVQTLADGNRIVRNSSSKVYRNSEGRIRRESKGGQGGSFGFSYMVTPSVSIMDPVVGQKYELDLALKTARVYEMRSGQGVTITGSGSNGVGNARAEELLAKLKAEGRLDKATTVLRAQAGSTAPVAVEKELAETAAALAANAGAYATMAGGKELAETAAALAANAGTYATMAGGYTTAFPVAAKSRYETKSEDLGTRDFEGVTAEGNRRTTIIPVGAIGNERPIEIVYERWYSKDLGMVVYSKTEDPRTGEQTYKLTNIVRSEPDPSLFSVPAEYHKVGQQGAVYRTAPVRPATKAVASPRVVSNQASGIKP